MKFLENVPRVNCSDKSQINLILSSLRMRVYARVDPIE